MPFSKRKSVTKSEEDDNDDSLLIEVTQERLRALQESQLLLSHDLTVDCLPKLLQSDMKGKLSVFLSCVEKKFGEMRGGSVKRMKKLLKKKSLQYQVELNRDQREVVLDTIRKEVQKYGDVVSDSDLAKNDHDYVSTSRTDGHDTVSQEQNEKNNNENIDGFEVDNNFSDSNDLWWKVVKEKLPPNVVHRYRRLCFGNFSKKWYPAIELGPRDVCGEVRKQWFTMFDAANDDAKAIEKICLVYWYGEERGSKDAYSFLAPINIVDYDEGVKQGYNKDKKIESKLKMGKTLTKSQLDWKRRIDQQQEELGRSKEDRIAWMALENVPLDELYYDESILSDGDGNEIDYNKKVRKTKQKSMKKKKLSPVASILEDDVDVFSDEGDDEDFDVDEENTDDEVKEDDYADDGKLKPRKKQKQDRKQSSADLKPVSSGKMADSDKKKAKKKKKKNAHQSILEENEALFIPLMLSLEAAVEEKNVKKSLKILRHFLDELQQMSATFVESYTPSKLITKARRAFKTHEMYSDVNNISKKINGQIKEQYNQEKPKVPKEFKPKLGVGHNKCDVFRYRPEVNTISRDSLEKGAVKNGGNEESSIVVVSNGSVPKSVDCTAIDNPKSRVIDRSRSKSVERVPGKRKQSPSLPKIDSRLNIVNRSASPKLSSGNSAMKSTESTSDVPIMKKTTLSLRGLIDSNIGGSGLRGLEKSESSQKIEKAIQQSKEENRSIHSLPDWLMKETSATDPKLNDVRLLAIEFLKQAIDVCLQSGGDDRIKKRSIIINLEAAIFEWSESLQTTTSNGCPRYWLKLHEIVSALVGKDHHKSQKPTLLAEQLLRGYFANAKDIVDLTKDKLSQSFQECEA